MATIMQKDVALEMIATTLALVSRKFNVDRYKGLPPVEEALVETRNKLYSTPYQNVDYEKVIKMCQNIKAEYKDIPDHSINWNANVSQ